jgi:hypothetical protein
MDHKYCTTLIKTCIKNLTNLNDRDTWQDSRSVGQNGYLPATRDFNPLIAFLILIVIKIQIIDINMNLDYFTIAVDSNKIS